MFRALICVLALCAFTVGCTKGNTDAAVDTGMYTVKSTYAVIQKAAIAYARLPRCSDATTIVCSKQAVVDDLVRLDAEATEKIKLGDLTASMFAVLALSSAVSSAQMENGP